MPHRSPNYPRQCAAAITLLLMLGGLVGCEIAAAPGEHFDGATADASHGTDADRIRPPAPADAVHLRGNEVRLLLLRRGR